MTPELTSFSRCAPEGSRLSSVDGNKPHILRLRSQTWGGVHTSLLMKGPVMRPGNGNFPGSLEESRTVLDSGCATLENREGPFLFLFPSNLAFRGIFFVPGWGKSVFRFRFRPCSIGHYRETLKDEERRPRPFTGICTKHVAEAGSGDTGNSRLSTSELAGPWWECRRRRLSSWAVSATRRRGPCRPRNSGPKSAMRLPWKHVLGPGRI